jgi:energy-coupling factor transporter ATP-binding protein EcfA2
MPGTRLNDTERRLLRAWTNGDFSDHPQLKSISISAQNGGGLRGISNLEIEFNYPVTFISGQNGCGKSTVLALAALGFHGEPGHLPTNAKRFSGRGAARFGYYTFKDFFHRGPGDADFTGIQIKWQYSDISPVSISKQSDKWMRYERRPARPVEFLGLSRAVPAIELSTLRNQFGVTARSVSAPLDAHARQHLERFS